jgi:tripartite tricarboxylate transporter TctB family protein
MTERVVALAMLIVSAIYLFQALRMPLGAAARPGPGFYPAAVGAFAFVVALVVTALAFRRAEAVAVGEAVEDVSEDRRRVWITVATLGGFCLLLPWIGYPLAALLLVATLLRQLGAGWLTAVLTAVLSAEGSYYLFAGLLGVTLPQGLWPH